MARMISILKKQHYTNVNFEYITNEKCADIMFPFIHQHYLSKTSLIYLTDNRMIDLKILFVSELIKVDVENFHIHLVVLIIFHKLVAIEKQAKIDDVYKSLFILLDTADDFCVTPFTVKILSKIRIIISGRSYYLRKVKPEEDHLFKIPPALLKKAEPGKPGPVRFKFVAVRGTPYQRNAPSEPKETQSLLKDVGSNDTTPMIGGNPMWNAFNYFRRTKLPVPAPASASEGSSSKIEPEMHLLDNFDAECICGNIAIFCCQCKKAQYCGIPCQISDKKDHEDVCDSI